MIAGAPKACLFVPEAFQMPFGRLRTLLLQGTNDLEGPTFDRFPAPLSQEAIV
jgi:hypothetical protein